MLSKRRLPLVLLLPLMALGLMACDPAPPGGAAGGGGAAIPAPDPTVVPAG